MRRCGQLIPPHSWEGVVRREVMKCIGQLIGERVWLLNRYECSESTRRPRGQTLCFGEFPWQQSPLGHFPVIFMPLVWSICICPDDTFSGILIILSLYTSGERF